MALHPLLALYVQISWDLDNHKMQYHIQASPYTQAEVLSEDEVIHIPALSLDGLLGLNPIEYNRESMALSIGVDRVLRWDHFRGVKEDQSELPGEGFEER